MTRSSKIALAVLAGLALLGLGSKSASANVITSTGPKKTRASTYEGDVAAWAKKRYAAAHDYLKKYWGEALGDDALKDAALSALAHWSLETGSGAGEYNFNVGNIHAVGAQPWFQSGDTSSAGKAYGASFASYDDLASGVEAYFTLLENHYSTCMQKLVDKPADADWFKCLGENGYYAKTMKGKDNIEPAAAGWAARRALLAQYATL